MNKNLLSSLILISFSTICFGQVQFAQAHCPYAFKVDSENYCLDLKWMKSEVRDKGKFVESKDLSPVLNTTNLRPSQWSYSKAVFKVWKENDPNHQPVLWDDFEVYPFMLMIDQHSHPSRSKTVLDKSNGLYTVSEMAFQQMTGVGCWTLRLKKAEVDLGELLKIESFTNLNATENFEIMSHCSICGGMDPEIDMEGHDHSHH